VRRAAFGAVDATLVWGVAPSERRPPSGRGHARYGTATLRFEADAPLDEVLAAIRAERPLRAKGFLRRNGAVWVVQGVGGELHLEPPRTDPPEDLVGLVVVVRAA
jgi:hypothetical protein